VFGRDRSLRSGENDRAKITSAREQSGLVTLRLKHPGPPSCAKART
jgi:hypothetical protein